MEFKKKTNRKNKVQEKSQETENYSFTHSGFCKNTNVEDIIYLQRTNKAKEKKKYE